MSKITQLNESRRVMGAVSEDAAALKFTERHRGVLLFCHSDGRWRIWKDNRWQIEGTNLALCWARDLCRELNRNNHPKPSSASFASGVERFARADRAFAVTSKIFDAHPFLLGTPGGTVDLRLGNLREAKPSEFISKATAITPAAFGDSPARWLEFLGEATGFDAELMAYLQRVVGYVLTGSVREHALFFVYGPGGNGKSVFLNTLAGMLGDYAITAPGDAFTVARGERHPTELAMFRGARLVVSSETEEGRAWAEQRIKSITGGDPITARFMRENFFTYRPEFKLMIVGNFRPTLHNVDDAVRRRFHIVPFTRKPETPDLDLEQKLKAEWPAILLWAIEGCREWQRIGLCPPAAVMEATFEYFEDQDLVAQWIEEECTTGGTNRTSSAELFRSWAKYAERQGERSGSAKAFGDALRRRGFKHVRKIGSRSLRGFAGIELKQPDLPAGDG